MTNALQQNYAICTHSTLETYIIFSCEIASKDLFTNAAATGYAEFFMNKHKVSFKKILGMYEGNLEQSFIINAKDFWAYEHLNRLHPQQTYLLLTNHKHGLRKAYLVPALEPLESAASDATFIGYLREVSREEALAETAYSYRPDVDKFWIVTQSDKTN